ncbi:VirB8 protein [compost metagenome]
MNEWLNGSADSSPFARAAKETAAVEIRSVLPQTPETWQVEWVETTRDRQGVKKAEGTYRALVTVYQAETNPNTKEEDIWMNPIRLFVRDFSWSKQI